MSFAPHTRPQWEEAEVPKYVVLSNWTDQGVRNAKDTVDRYQTAKQLAESKGAKFEAHYWTTGSYDFVSVIEAPNGDTVAALVLQLASGGNIRSTSMRAFTEDEMQGIIAKMD